MITVSPLPTPPNPSPPLLPSRARRMENTKEIKPSKHGLNDAHMHSERLRQHSQNP